VGRRAPRPPSIVSLDAGAFAMDLNARIIRLERRNRLLIGVVTLFAVLTPVGVLLPRMRAADESKGTAVDVAERLVLRNANGGLAATLVATPNGGSLSLCDANGKPRMVFAVGKEGPNLGFLDANQSGDNKGVRLALSTSDKTGPSVSLFGASGALPLASARTKPAAGSTPASGAFVAVNEEGRPVAFPRTVKPESDEPGPAAATNRN